MGVAENVCHFNGAINIIMLGILFLGGTNLIDLNSKDNHPQHPQLQIWVGQLAEANGRVSRANVHR